MDKQILINASQVFKDLMVDDFADTPELSAEEKASNLALYTAAKAFKFLANDDQRADLLTNLLKETFGTSVFYAKDLKKVGNYYARPVYVDLLCAMGVVGYAKGAWWVLE